MLTKLIATLCLLLLAACGARVEVPPGYIGCVLSPKGLETAYREPSSFRLPITWPWGAKYRLVLAETSDNAVEDDLQIFMPKDNLNVQLELRMTTSVTTDARTLGVLFNRLTPSATSNSRVLEISSKKVYATYAEPKIRERVRSLVSECSIQDLLTNRTRICAEIEKAIQEDLKDVPIRILNLGFADIQPPAVIVEAQESAARRAIQVQEAQAEQAIALIQADARLAVAEKQKAIDLLEAATQAEQERILAGVVSEAYVTQRGLSILQQLSQSDNHVVLLPYEALSNPAILLHGLQK